MSTGRVSTGRVSTGRLITRRRLLAGGAALVAAAATGEVLVETRVLPGRGPLHRALGLTGEDGAPPDVVPGPTVSGSFSWAARRTTVGWSVTYPPGSAPGLPLPVVVMLHGRGGDHTFGVAALGIDRYLAAAVAAGAAPFALAGVDGGSGSYWHRRASREDPQRMLAGEFLPLLAVRGLRTGRVGLLGWSMGGYGALLAAASWGPGRVAAVAASSPALWRSFEDAAAGAFDGAEDFRANDVFTRVGALGRVPLWIDCGRDDPFASATRQLRSSLEPEPAGGLQPGEHTGGYWRRMLPDQLSFLTTHLG